MPAAKKTDTPAAPDQFPDLKVGDEVILESQRGTYTRPVLHYRTGRIEAAAAKSVVVKAAGLSGRYKRADGRPVDRHSSSARIVPDTAESRKKVADCRAVELAAEDANKRAGDDRRRYEDRVVPRVIAWLREQDDETVRRFVGVNDLVMWGESLARDGKIELAPEDHKRAESNKTGD